MFNGETECFNFYACMFEDVANTPSRPSDFEKDAGEKERERERSLVGLRVTTEKKCP